MAFETMTSFGALAVDQEAGEQLPQAELSNGGEISLLLTLASRRLRFRDPDRLVHLLPCFFFNRQSTPVKPLDFPRSDGVEGEKRTLFIDDVFVLSFFLGHVETSSGDEPTIHVSPGEGGGGRTSPNCFL